nr:MAG TPA: hypothetical protein [Microviridae sp.]
MKKIESFKVDKLAVDVLEYAFIEWLVRRGIFTAFRLNYDRVPTARKTFRDCLRDHIRHVYRNPSLGPESLVSSAFLFTSAPEGYEFWIKHSDAWRRFYNSL